MGWLSRLALKLDAEGKAALRQAAFEENVRLALWRMDSALTGLISLENARPYSTYQSLIRSLPETANAVPTGDLSSATQSLLYFQFEPDGRLVLPGAAKVQSAQLDQLRRKVTKSSLLKSIQYTTDILTVQKSTVPETPAKNSILARTEKQAPFSPSAPATQSQTDLLPAANSVPPSQSRTNQDTQQILNTNELNVRLSVTNNNLMINAPARSQSQAEIRSEPQAQPVPEKKPAMTSDSVRTTRLDTNLELMHPVWLDKDLFLVRRVSIGKQEYVQGCRLDWPAIRAMLVKLVEDLLPQADVAPLLQPPAPGQTRLLASISAQLIPGPIPAESQDGWSILHVSLAIAWIGVLLATLAVGVVLRRTMELNQRRGAFVSAVTHELRTPLTTFRIYTEMLNEGMVTDGKKQKQYFGTLHNEAERLSHLVENVLTYAQLENNRGGAERIEIVKLIELKERVVPRLADRAAQSGMELAVVLEDAARDSAVRVDIPAAERILFNLVDNAAKYGGKAQNDILFSIELKKGMAVLSIRDHGPGISPRLRKKLFMPFSKSASEAANSAPGVGLGLSISRRLAQQMHGNLVLDPAVTDGARFVLTLPLGAFES
jgi:signal transduction histidine kinase